MIERRASELYGPNDTRNLEGVLHVVSAVEVEGRLHVIKIGPRAPKSATDFFVLNFWRAHADAILTSAQVVRAEPKLSHELQGPDAEALERYRSHTLHKPDPPLCAILTRSGGLPLEHRIWTDHVENHVLTPADRAAELQAALGTRAEVIGLDPLDPKRAVQWLREQGARTIVIEAGPSTANQLYEPPAAVDHLLLSCCDITPDPVAVGGALSARLFDGLTRISSTARDEESGPWRFERYDRNQS